MMDQAEVTITKCDNGFVLEWHKPFFKKKDRSAIGLLDEPTSGKEVHTSMTSVLGSAKKHLR